MLCLACGELLEPDPSAPTVIATPTPTADTPTPAQPPPQSPPGHPAPQSFDPAALLASAADYQPDRRRPTLTPTPGALENPASLSPAPPAQLTGNPQAAPASQQPVPPTSLVQPAPAVRPASAPAPVATSPVSPRPPSGSPPAAQPMPTPPRAAAPPQVATQGQQSSPPGTSVAATPLTGAGSSAPNAPPPDLQSGSAPLSRDQLAKLPPPESIGPRTVSSPPLRAETPSFTPQAVEKSPFGAAPGAQPSRGVAVPYSAGVNAEALLASGKPTTPANAGTLPSRERLADPIPQTSTKLAPSRKPQPGDKICGQCGETNAPARNFCQRCGHDLNDSPVVAVPWWQRLRQRWANRRRRTAGERPQLRGKARKWFSGARYTIRRVFMVLAVIALIFGMATPDSYLRKPLNQARRCISDRINVPQTELRPQAGPEIAAAFNGVDDVWSADEVSPFRQTDGSLRLRVEFESPVEIFAVSVLQPADDVPGARWTQMELVVPDGDRAKSQGCPIGARSRAVVNLAKTNTAAKAYSPHKVNLGGVSAVEIHLKSPVPEGLYPVAIADILLKGRKN